MSIADGWAPAPYGPAPSARQLAWHALEFYGFLHLTVNTFMDKEWGYGDESPAVFNPGGGPGRTDLDADQIVEAAQAAGMKGLVLTAKHHDGFCLWPSRFTAHSVKNSPWRNGQGDVVREVSQACQRRGLRFGVYLSPWDRNHPDYGRAGYLTYYRNQLRELLENYGPLFEVWFDGANGGDGYYGGARERREIDRASYYDWEHTWQLVRDLQPGACIFSDAGPDVRWVGNERGIAGETCWATLNRDDFVPGSSDAGRLNRGDRPAGHWVPAECDVSIRPGWFYHPAEDGRVRSPDNLLDLYFQSVGRGASLLLNLPPDRRGRIHERDLDALRGFRTLFDETFAVDLARSAISVSGSAWEGDARFGPRNVLDGRRDTYWYPGDAAVSDTAGNAAAVGCTAATGAEAPGLVLEFGRAIRFNIAGLREYLPLGQRIEAFAFDVWQDGGWRLWGGGTSVGNRRLVRGEAATTDKVRLRLVQAAACPAVTEVSLFDARAIKYTAAVS